jgi:hypothetical protein
MVEAPAEFGQVLAMKLIAANETNGPLQFGTGWNRAGNDSTKFSGHE